MKYLIIIILLTGCSTPTKPTSYNTDLTIKIVPTKDFSKLEKKYNFKSLAGLTEYWVIAPGRCVLYIPILSDVYDAYTMCIAGHELFHCILGDFHTDDEADSCY